MSDNGRRVSLWLPVLVGVLLTPVLFLGAMIPCGMGHGDCRLLGVFFPLMLVAVLGDEFINPMFLAAAHFPLAGVAFWAAYRAGRLKLFAVGMLVVHVVGAVLVYTL